MYTGGTTGKPKGVVWRQSDLLHSLVVPIFQPLGVTELPTTLDEAVAIAVEAHREGSAPTTMPVVPLMHATGLFNTMGALMVGGRAVTARQGGLDPEHVWRTVAEQRVATVIVAGNAVCRPLVDELVRAEQAGTPHALRSVRRVLSSGTALSDVLKRRLHERAEITVIDAIASSEGGPFAFAITSSLRDLPARFFPVPATRVIGDNDRFVEPGSDDIGRLAYCGPMPLGYYKDTEKSATTFRTIDGVRYAIPGDLARLEADGAIRFLGRGSGVINTGGEKVHPQEVENALLSHPGVTDCVVVGVPDETWGERVAAVVAVRADTTVTGEELRDWARQSLMRLQGAALRGPDGRPAPNPHRQARSRLGQEDRPGVRRGRQGVTVGCEQPWPTITPPRGPYGGPRGVPGSVPAAASVRTRRNPRSRSDGRKGLVPGRRKALGVPRVRRGPASWTVDTPASAMRRHGSSADLRVLRPGTPTAIPAVSGPDPGPTCLSLCSPTHPTRPKES